MTKNGDNEAGVSEDAVLGGRIRLRQPLKGHRVGHDAILLAAACGALGGQAAIEFGAGVGAAGLALAARVPDVTITLVEVDEALCRLAAQNIALNHFEGRVRVQRGDVCDAAALAGLPLADHVLMNPPFHDPARAQMSPDAGRRLAYGGGALVLGQWINAAASMLKTSGVLTLIWRADGLDEVRQALAGQFGAIAITPVHPKPGAVAIRVLVRAVKGAPAGETMLGRLDLNGPDVRPSAAAEAVLREGKALPIADLAGSADRP